MNDNVLNITWCYPDLLNLHGDRGNIMAFERIGKMLDLKVNVKKVTNLEDTIDFENSDILFFNPGELKMVKPIIETLSEVKEQLNGYVERGKMILAIGTTGAIFAKKICRISESFEGLGYLDMTCTERENVYGDDIIFRLNEDENIQINGSQIHIIDTHLETDISLGTCIYGYGNEGFESKKEGAKYKNLIFTNCLGPLLVKNPWYAEKLIREAMAIKSVNVSKKVPQGTYDIEEKSMECIQKYNEKKLLK